MKTIPLTFKAKVWLYPGDAAWHFITIPKNESSIIKECYIWPRRGFGAIPVNVITGQTAWRTSVFPQKEDKYLLPIKKQVRSKEHIQVGDTIQVHLQVIN